MTHEDIIRIAREAGSIDSEGVIETVYAAFAAAALESPVEEPVAWRTFDGEGGVMKIVINRCHGGFGLSEPALTRYCQLKEVDDVYEWEIDRSDPVLVSVVSDLGSEADGACSSLKVVEIPDGVDWVLQEYDGMEWIAERHRIWN